MSDKPVCSGPPPAVAPVPQVRFGLHLATCAAPGAAPMLLVSGVEPASPGRASPATEAGVQARMVVLAYNGCTGTPDELLRRLADTPAGTAVELVLGLPTRQTAGAAAPLRQQRVVLLPLPRPARHAAPAAGGTSPWRPLTCNEMHGHPAGPRRAL